MKTTHLLKVNDTNTLPKDYKEIKRGIIKDGDITGYPDGRIEWCRGLVGLRIFKLLRPIYRKTTAKKKVRTK